MITFCGKIFKLGIRKRNMPRVATRGMQLLCIKATLHKDDYRKLAFKIRSLSCIMCVIQTQSTFLCFVDFPKVGVSGRNCIVRSNVVYE